VDKKGAGMASGTVLAPFSAIFFLLLTCKKRMKKYTVPGLYWFSKLKPVLLGAHRKLGVFRWFLFFKVIT
jgi:hypothetical protein